jgi:hypothetical protein
VMTRNRSDPPRNPALDNRNSLIFRCPAVSLGRGGLNGYAGDRTWHHQTFTLNSDLVGAGDWWRRRPVQLSLYNPDPGTVVDVDNVRLLDDQGRDLIANGDFERGGDDWFFKAGDHLPWHVKNLWVHLLFEQGWVGLILFNVILLVSLGRLARAGWQGNSRAYVLLAALAGLLTVGMFDSLLDAPRLATLLCLLVLVGLNPAAFTQLPSADPPREAPNDSVFRHELSHSVLI